MGSKRNPVLVFLLEVLFLRLDTTTADWKNAICGTTSPVNVGQNATIACSFKPLENGGDILIKRVSNSSSGPSEPDFVFCRCSPDCKVLSVASVRVVVDESRVSSGLMIVTIANCSPSDNGEYHFSVAGKQLSARFSLLVNNDSSTPAAPVKAGDPKQKTAAKVSLWLMLTIGGICIGLLILTITNKRKFSNPGTEAENEALGGQENTVNNKELINPRCSLLILFGLLLIILFIGFSIPVFMSLYDY